MTAGSSNELILAIAGKLNIAYLMVLFLIGVLAVGLSTANSLLMVMSTIIYKPHHAFH